MEWALKEELKGKTVSHAYLFYGSQEETLATATAFALALNCLQPQDDEACGVCRPCTLGKTESFSDFTILRPEKTNYTIGQMRELIKLAQFAAQEGEYRIFLLANAEKLTDISANALLKTLEEPVGNTVFLLLSDHADKMPATIESRCRIIRQNSREASESQRNFDEAYKLLTTLATQSFDAILTLAQNYGQGKNKEHDRENLRGLMTAMSQIFSDNYSYRQGNNHRKAYLLDAEEFDDNVLFSLWETINDSFKNLEYQVTTQLIAENLFLAIKEILGSSEA